MTVDLDRFFAPAGIAVVGASRSPEKLGYVLLDNLQRARYQGRLYPVSPNAERILGLECFPNVSELPEVVCSDPSVDAVIAMLTPQRVTEPERTARVISYMAREQQKPLLGVFMGGGAVSRARDMLDEARVPVYPYPERAVRALAALTWYGAYRRDIA